MNKELSKDQLEKLLAESGGYYFETKPDPVIYETQPVPVIYETQGGYTPKGYYNDYGVSDESKKTIEYYQEMYKQGQELGDRGMMDFAHEMAEKERAKYGYSGGVDGSDYIEIAKKYGNSGFMFPLAPTFQSSGSGTQQPSQTEQPAYTANNQANIDALLNEILNREDFKYEEAPTYTDKYTEQINQILGEIQNRNQFQYGNAPTYTDQYAGQINQLMQQIQNREDFTYGNAPTYQDAYADQISQLMQQIQNREDFSYNVNNDPLYGMYAQQYTQQGQRSMKDTLGQLAAQTGGMASSYAASAAQQANDYYMSQLAAKIPELQQIAYGQYRDDVNKDLTNLDLLRSQQTNAYNQYRDQVADYNADRAMAYGQYMDEVNEDLTNLSLLRDQQNLAYNQFRDQVSDYNADRTLAYNQYLNELDADVRELGLLQNQSDNDYNRYRDALNDWSNDRAIAYGQYLDKIDNKVRDLGLLQSMDETQYNRYRDTMNDWRNDRDFAYGVHRDDISDSRYQDELDYEKAWNNAQMMAGMGDFSGYANLGISSDVISSLEQAWKDMNTKVEAPEPYKPTLTWPQVKAEIEAGNASDAVLKAYEYYMGESYAPAPGKGYDENPEPTGTGGYNPSEWGYVLNNIKTNLREGNEDALNSYMDQIADNLSQEQWEEIEALLRQYGI